MSLIKLSITLPASASKLDQSGRCSTQSVYVGVSPSENCRFPSCTLRRNFLLVWSCDVKAKLAPLRNRIRFFFFTCNVVVSLSWLNRDEEDKKLMKSVRYDFSQKNDGDSYITS